MKKNLIKIAFVSALAALAISCSCSNNSKEQKQEDMTFDITNLPAEPEFDIITDMGTIRIKLYSETPKHRDNFAKLASEGFYNGILFHRVINGFMIQAGDPLTKDPSKADMYGTGGPGYTVPAEFVSSLTHKKGAIAAARRGDSANPKRESSGSQFYIVQDAESCAQLDGAYTVFGETINGIDVIDKIATVATDRRDRPVNDIRIKQVKLVLPEGVAETETSNITDAADSTEVKDSSDAK